MSVQVKRRRDTAANLASYVGAQAELLVDTTNNRVQVHDGVTAGGWPAAKLSEVVTNGRTAVSDAAYTASASDRSIAFAALTAARVVTMPAASAYPTGTRLIVFDESGSCSAARTITLNAAGSDTIDGASSAAISSAYGFLALQSDGAGKWTIVDQAASNIGPVGIGTAADPSNPLSVYGPSALFNGVNFNVTVNKAAAGDTASFIFEDGFSGRAQIGLCGDDNFRFKVSTDGSSWTTGIEIDAATGAPSFANQRTAISDAAYSALPTDRLLAYTALTAARVVSLPSAASYPAGARLTVVDESGSCSATNTITLACAGSDAINGGSSEAVSAAYGYVAIESNGSNKWTIVDAPGGGGGSGGVTSVGLSLPSMFSVSGSPVTASGTLTATLASKTANLVLAGPSSGSPAAPTFRALALGDLPAGVATNARTAVSDAAYSVLTTDRLVAYTALTAARAVSLPSAASYPTGARLTVVDESGSCSATRTITLACAGSDTINSAASAAMNTAYAYLTLESNGSNAWTIVDVTGGGSVSLAGLSDVSVTEGAGINGYTLNWNNTASKWEAVAPVAGGSLAIGAAISGATDGDGLYVNSSAELGEFAYGTGVFAALGVAIGSAGSPVLFNGALGTPSSGAATNLTGTAASLTAGAVPATGVTAGALGSGVTINNANWSGTPLANGNLANSTISGIALGSNLDTLTFGTHLSAGGSSYNGSASVTISTDATSANTASTIVARDGSGNFSAGTITASLTGHASLDLPLSGGTMSGSIAMGSNAITGASSIASGAVTITSSSANALAAGLNGPTKPALNVDASTSSSATGLNVKSAAAGSGLAVSVISSGSNENLTLNAKGSGTIGFGNVSTGAVTITPALTLSGALTYGGVTLSNAVTGTGEMVLQTSPSLTTPALGAATGASLALNGATLGSNALAATGTAAISGALTSAAHAIASASVNALVAGPNGATNPAFNVDASTSSAATGLNVKAAAAGSGLAASVSSSGANESLSINAKGSGSIALGNVSSGGVTIGAGSAITSSGAGGALGAFAFASPASPPAVGGTTPAAGAFTTLSATGLISAAASTTSGASLNLPQGSAPSAPNNGDLWTTSAGLYARIAGSTVGPLGTGGGGGGVTGPGSSVSGDIATFNGTSGGTIQDSGLTPQSLVSTYAFGGLVNKWRNAPLDVWQRGTSMTVTTSGQYTADGHFVLPTGASVAVAQASGRSLSVNSLKITGATSVTDVQLKQPIESYVAAALTSQVVTFQAQIYNNTGASITPTLSVKHPSAADNYGSSTTDISAVSLQSCANGAWTQVAYSWTASASSALGMEIVLDFGANFSSSAKSVQIAEADLRVTPGVATGLNSSAPPPELRPIFAEMEFNQRYFATSYGNGVAPGTATHAGIAGGYFGTTAITAPVMVALPAQMRAAPTIAYWDGAGAASKYSIIVSGTTWTDAETTGTAQIPFTVALTSFLANVVSGAGTDAYFHYTASAEIAP